MTPPCLGELNTWLIWFLTFPPLLLFLKLVESFCPLTIRQQEAFKWIPSGSVKLLEKRKLRSSSIFVLLLFLRAEKHLLRYSDKKSSILFIFNEATHDVNHFILTKPYKPNELKYTARVTHRMDQSKLSFRLEPFSIYTRKAEFQETHMARYI